MKRFIDKNSYFTNRYECDGKYGIEDRYGVTMVSCEYDSIFECGGFGYILCKNSKYGYIDFIDDIEEINRIYENEETYRSSTIACGFFPCRYDKIEQKNHGLQLYTMPHFENGRFIDEKYDWYDFKEQRIYHNHLLMKGFKNYDCLLETNTNGTMPFLKKSGEEKFIKFSEESCIDILNEVPLYDEDIQLFLCDEQMQMSYEEIMADEKLKAEVEEFLAENEHDKEYIESIFGDYMKYFFLVVGKDGSWWLGQAKRSPNELYENFSRELEIHKERYRQIQECKQRSAEEKNDRKTDNL